MEERHNEKQPVETASNNDAAAVNTAESPGKKKRKGRTSITIAVVAAIVLLAGAGLWTWHETPGFCGAICHYPMDSYLETYNQEPGTAAIDKYGNAVSDASSMLAVAHKAEGQTCLSCHVPTLSEQVTEGLEWVSGNYEVVEAPGTVSGFALSSRSLADLTEARGASADEFCLNESCHNLTRDELAEKTSGLSRNPHDPHHGNQDCGTCHKGHSASVMYCSQCHEDSPQPDGWLTWDEYKAQK